MYIFGSYLDTKSISKSIGSGVFERTDNLYSTSLNKIIPFKTEEQTDSAVKQE